MLDTVGIACDEAMSPRMVPVADAVFGVQKFNQDSWGVMASIEDAALMAQGVTRLIEEPDSFACLTSNAARTTYSIKQVIHEYNRDDLVASVVSDASRTGQFAFYVFRNGKRIHAQWSFSNLAMRFRIHIEAGLYRVLLFFLFLNGSRMTKYSNPVFLYPAVYHIGQTFKNA
jgi:hypothetical protein